MSEPHKIVVRVWFAHIAAMRDVEWCMYLHQLSKKDGIYFASTEADYLALLHKMII